MHETHLLWFIWYGVLNEPRSWHARWQLTLDFLEIEDARFLKTRFNFWVSL
jgi:hypothetical protein